jgi:diaminopimelate epimerase
MQVEFYKYQGTGNDFIVIDNRKEVFDKTLIQTVKKLCNPKFGIGADGLILIENLAGYDFNMIYFNADGSKSFCGNGSRCAINFAKYLGIINTETRFLSTDGEHTATISNDIISLKMHNVTGVELGENFYFLNTGSPHYIVFCEDATSINVFDEGKKIRFNERFKKDGTNVNFASLKNSNTIFVRTYERGVENETLSCGTGVTATAIAANIHFSLNINSINVETPGGNLQVSFKSINATEFSEIWLTGPAEKVFKGYIEI